MAAYVRADRAYEGGLDSKPDPTYVNVPCGRPVAAGFFIWGAAQDALLFAQRARWWGDRALG